MSNNIKINGEFIETTVGRVIFNEIVPEEMGFWNELLIKKVFSGFIALLIEVATVT